MHKRALGVASVVLFAAAAGTAFTASNDTSAVGSPTAGYGSVNVSGAVVKSVKFSHSADSTKIIGAEITFAADQTGNTVRVGFGSGASTDCTVLLTVATCTLDQATSTADTFNIAVFDAV